MLIEEEIEESKLFTFDWMENPSKKYENENRFMVVSVVTNTLLPIIEQSINNDLNLFLKTHFENFVTLFKVSNYLWKPETVRRSLSNPILFKLQRSVINHQFIHFVLMYRFRIGVDGPPQP